jgi:hypothetical protein
MVESTDTSHTIHPTASANASPIVDFRHTGPVRKVVFSRALKIADWANTTIAAGGMAEEIDKLRRGGDGHTTDPRRMSAS